MAKYMTGIPSKIDCPSMALDQISASQRAWARDFAAQRTNVTPRRLILGQCRRLAHQLVKQIAWMGWSGGERKVCHAGVSENLSYEGLGGKSMEASDSIHRFKHLQEGRQGFLASQ